MARPSESETDSLGLSAESERERERDGGLAGRWASGSEAELRPGGSEAPPPAVEADLQEYGKSLGTDLRKDVDLTWIVREAFEAPLPSSWTEHVDAEGRVYFFNAVTEESTWSHPMDNVYRELLELIHGVRDKEATLPLERRASAVRDHLMEVHTRALAQLEGWSGPYPSETGQYYYNERQSVSTWVSPIEGWEYELAVRHSVLHRCLLAGDAGEEEDADDGESFFEAPILHLPLGLARREDDGQNSSRSFYTARESSRSGMSARSMGRSPAGAVSPPAVASPPPSSTPTRASTPPNAASATGSLAAPVPSATGSRASTPTNAASATGAPVAAASLAMAGTKGAQGEDTEDGALEVTFGRTESLKMPVVGTT
mmetsp:Transcript_87621/g.194947  ORF Transcript_87621/g.194947 Transcript_87621/m.194947 type:complete len:372 (-) Transcript_87621:98-1213(-)